MSRRMRARETLLKKKYVSVQAMKRIYGYTCVYVCVIINQISSRQLLVCVCVCVIEALLEGL